MLAAKVTGIRTGMVGVCDFMSPAMFPVRKGRGKRVLRILFRVTPPEPMRVSIGGWECRGCESEDPAVVKQGHSSLQHWGSLQGSDIWQS